MHAGAGIVDTHLVAASAAGVMCSVWDRAWPTGRGVWLVVRGVAVKAGGAEAEWVDVCCV